MRLLLDTHALLWWVGDLPRLGPAARSSIAEAAVVHVSAVSGAEIAIKKAKGKLKAPADLTEQVVANGFTELPFQLRHGLAMAELPQHHRDPFDRMLVAQARVDGLRLVTADPRIVGYDISTLRADR